MIIEPEEDSQLIDNDFDGQLIHKANKSLKSSHYHHNVLLDADDKFHSNNTDLQLKLNHQLQQQQNKDLNDFDVTEDYIQKPYSTD